VGAIPPAQRASLARFLTRARRAAGLTGDVSVLLAGDSRLKELNRGFRGKNKATDVLSFPAAENGAGVAGDLAISLETAARQAAAHGHSLDDELRVLLLHGVLHLAGWDHETDAGEMRALETELRTKLRLPGGLIERTLQQPATVKKQLAMVKKPTLGAKVPVKKSAGRKRAMPAKAKAVATKQRAKR
jgi:probable rRNA maturation factor